MCRFTAFALITAVLGLAVATPGQHAAAQQAQQVSFTASPENTKFTQQENIEVGDVPKHIVRDFEVHRTYPDNAPVLNGIKLVEEWDRGIGDLTDGNGSSTTYDIFVMENGDKFFARSAVVVQSSAGKLTSTSVGYITGGTGKFAGMQGFVRASSNFDIKTGRGDNQTNIEYTVGK